MTGYRDLTGWSNRGNPGLFSYLYHRYSVNTGHSLRLDGLGCAAVMVVAGLASLSVAVLAPLCSPGEVDAPVVGQEESVAAVMTHSDL